MIKVNWLALRGLSQDETVLLLPISVEADEQWSFVAKKTNQRWLWVALHHFTHQILAFTFGTRREEVCQRLKKLLSPFHVVKYFTDGLIAYENTLPEHQHEIGKRNTQKVERKFLTLRARIKRLTRRTICFSKSIIMHDTIIGLFINRYEFERNV